MKFMAKYFKSDWDKVKIPQDATHEQLIEFLNDVGISVLRDTNMYEKYKKWIKDENQK